MASNYPMSSLWRNIWKRPDPQLAEVGFSGEYVIASVRLLLVALLIYIPRDLLGGGFGDRRFQAVLIILGAALFETLLVYAAVQRDWGRSWLGFVSSLTDVTLVSLVLAMYLLLASPAAALGDPVVYPFYFLALGATSLRYDSRVCLATGSLAILQYGLLVYAARARWPAATSNHFEPFNLAHQVIRLGLLLFATFLAVSLVVRIREASTQSIRDRLTGLLNRRVFDDRLQEEAARAGRTDSALGVAMIDVDRFKDFNDTFGHEGGDEALKAVGDLLLQSFRATDVVARYGGEEFAVVLPGIDKINAFKRMESVRIATANLAIDLRGRPLPAGVTVSIGVAIWPDDGETIEEVMALADSRLYQAKQAGRNRVVCPIEIDIPQELIPPPSEPGR